MTAAANIPPSTMRISCPLIQGQGHRKAYLALLLAQCRPSRMRSTWRCQDLIEEGIGNERLIFSANTRYAADLT